MKTSHFDWAGIFRRVCLVVLMQILVPSINFAAAPPPPPPDCEEHGPHDGVLCVSPGVLDNSALLTWTNQTVRTGAQIHPPVFIGNPFWSGQKLLYGYYDCQDCDPDILEDYGICAQTAHLFPESYEVVASFTPSLPTTAGSPGTNQYTMSVLGMSVSGLCDPIGPFTFPITIKIPDVVDPPSCPIALSPLTNQVGYVGGSASFTVTASGAAPIKFRWYFNGSLISGQTSSQLWLAGLNAGHAGSYSVTASNVCGLTTNSPAWLTVLTNAVNTNLLYDVKILRPSDNSNIP